jgi:hypothetical protein
MEKAKNQHVPVTARDRQPNTLADLGISKPQSSRWQKLAAIPECEFEQTVTGGSSKPTTNGLIAAHTDKPANLQNGSLVRRRLA